MKTLKALRFSFSVHVRSFSVEYAILLLVVFLVFMLAGVVWGFSPYTPFHSQEYASCASCWGGCAEGSSYGDGKAFCTAIGFLASSVGVLSIIFTIATLKKTQSLFEAQMLIDFDKQYAKPSMVASLRELGSFSRSEANRYVFMEHRNDDYNPESRCIFTPQDNFRWSREIDAARRDVKFYFINTYDLYMEGKISRSIFLRIINKSGIVLFFDVVEKLEYFTNPDYDSHKFYHIMLLAGEIYTKQKTESARTFDKRNHIKRVLDASPNQKSESSDV